MLPIKDAKTLITLNKGKLEITLEEKVLGFVLVNKLESKYRKEMQQGLVSVLFPNEKAFPKQRAVVQNLMHILDT